MLRKTALPFPLPNLLASPELNTESWRQGGGPTARDDIICRTSQGLVILIMDSPSSVTRSTQPTGRPSTCRSGACPHRAFLHSCPKMILSSCLLSFLEGEGGFFTGHLRIPSCLWMVLGIRDSSFEMDGPELKSCFLICMILVKLFNISLPQILPVLNENETRNHLTVRSGRTMDH